MGKLNKIGRGLDKGLEKKSIRRGVLNKLKAIESTVGQLSVEEKTRLMVKERSKFAQP